jgi:hypothetical protein
MIITTKIMIGVFSFWVLATIICNWFDGQANVLTATNLAEMSSLSSVNSVTTTQSVQTTGETSSPLQWVSGAKNTILKWIEFKYSFWYDAILPGYDSASCTAAGGEWDGTSLCYFPGPWEIVHSAFLRPIGWAIVLTFVAIGIGKLFGA